MGERKAAVEAHRRRKKFCDWRRTGDLVKPEMARYCNRAREGVLMAVRPPTMELVEQLLRLKPSGKKYLVEILRKKVWGRSGTDHVIFPGWSSWNLHEPAASSQKQRCLRSTPLQVFDHGHLKPNGTAWVASIRLKQVVPSGIVCSLLKFL